MVAFFQQWTVWPVLKHAWKRMWNTHCRSQKYVFNTVYWFTVPFQSIALKAEWKLLWPFPCFAVYHCRFTNFHILHLNAVGLHCHTLASKNASLRDKEDRVLWAVFSAKPQQYHRCVLSWINVLSVNNTARKPFADLLPHLLQAFGSRTICVTAKPSVCLQWRIVEKNRASLATLYI